MSFIEWTQDFCVSHDEMDKQHQMLFDYVNEYYTALEEGASNDVLVVSYQNIINYTDFHFKDEERLLFESNYSDYEIHKRIHETLVDSAVAFMVRLKEKEQGVEHEIKHFLKIWLTAHIKGIDKKYSDCVNLRKKVS